MSACLTVESELAHLSTIQQALTRLTESGVPLQISGLKLSRKKPVQAAINQLSKRPTSVKHYPSVSLQSTSEIASDFKEPNPLPPTTLKRKTCHLDDDLDEESSDDESDPDLDLDTDDDELEVLDDAEELVPLLGESSVAKDSAPDDANGPAAMQ